MLPSLHPLPHTSIHYQSTLTMLVINDSLQLSRTKIYQEQETKERKIGMGLNVMNTFAFAIFHFLKSHTKALALPSSLLQNRKLCFLSWLGGGGQRRDMGGEISSPSRWDNDTASPSLSHFHNNYRHQPA